MRPCSHNPDADGLRDLLAPDLPSVDAWQHDRYSLARVGRKLWLAALAVLLALAVALASFGLPSIGSEPAEAAPVHTYCSIVGYRTVQGQFSWNKHETWQEPIYRCTYIEHNHSPFADWLGYVPQCCQNCKLVI